MNNKIIERLINGLFKTDFSIVYVLSYASLIPVEMTLKKCQKLY